MGQAEVVSEPSLKLNFSDKTFDNSFVSQKIINLDLKTKPKMSKVNLDALIPREDFVAQGDNDNKQKKINTLTLGHLLPSGGQNYISVYHLLKKPDFQRETNEWDKKRITDLIECFIERAFIPSIILWENDQNGNIYVIDGAHRISAILAYINDDYGDREISNKFYGYNKIPQAEIDLADETRTYINKQIGSFTYVMEQGGHKADGLKKAAFDVQIITGDVKKAEDSFFKINQQGVVLSPTEKVLCKSRELPSCIATRAVIKGGFGTQYWKNFEAQNQNAIKDIADELNTLLFKPPYNDSSKSIVLHHPLGGNITNATPMVFDLMKIIKANYLPGKEEKDLLSGSDTLQYLVLTRKIIWKILSEQSGSLGLFPSVYFYNSSGKFIQSAFLGMIQLFVENERNDNVFLPKFTKVRERLEGFILNYKVFITQINRTYGSKERSYRHMKGFFLNLIEYLDQGLSDENILKELKTKKNFDFLNENESDIEKPKSKKFNIETKIAVSNKEEIQGTPKCKICGGYIHPNSKSIDHKVDLKFGGGSEVSNAQTTHYYCNMSKDKLVKLGIYVSDN
jgi:hypothetical protein